MTETTIINNYFINDDFIDYEALAELEERFENVLEATLGTDVKHIKKLDGCVLHFSSDDDMFVIKTPNGKVMGELYVEFEEEDDDGI